MIFLQKITFFTEKKNNMDFKRIMIGLDFTTMDQSVLSYASYIANFLEVEKVYFIHITLNLALDKEFMKEYNLDNLSSDEKIIEKMKDVVKYNFSYSKATLDFSVHEGSITEEFLHWVDVKEIDLIIAGRKSTMGGSGLIPTRLARSSKASILFVPENSKESLNKIVVPIDYSEYSKNALQTAIKLNHKNNNEGTIICENVYYVPLGYYKTGKSYEEFAEIMKQNATKNFKQFSNVIEGTYEAHYSLDEDTNPADKIYEFAQSTNSNLIVMGGKGRTFASSIMIGSVAEKLISYDTNIPLLIVKNKNEKWGFWEAIKSM